MRQGVVLPETPRDRRNLQGLAEDMQDSPLAGKRLAMRLRHFRPDASSYLASLGGPPPYMARLREIAALTAEHERVLGEEYELRGDDPSAWHALAERWDFSEVNDLIDRHNHWYPVGGATADGSDDRRPRARQRRALFEAAARRYVGARAVPARGVSRDVAASVRAQSTAAST